MSSVVSAGRGRKMLDIRVRVVMGRPSHLPRWCQRDPRIFWWTLCLLSTFSWNNLLRSLWLIPFPPASMIACVKLHQLGVQFPPRLCSFHFSLASWCLSASILMPNKSPSPKVGLFVDFFTMSLRYLFALGFAYMRWRGSEVFLCTSQIHEIFFWHRTDP